MSWREKNGFPCGIAVVVVIHNVHDVLDVPDMLDVLTKSPSLYQVQELRY